MPKFYQKHQDRHPILDAANEVCARASSVKISQDGIGLLAQQLSSSPDTEHWLTSAPAQVTSHLDSLPLAGQIVFLTVFHSAGFSYWGEPRWSVKDAGTTYNGSMAWLICLSKEERCLQPKFLSALTEVDLLQITQGETSTQMPMLPERLAILKRLGAKLERDADALMSELTAGGAALDLAFRLSKELPGFDDSAVYDELPIAFLKRAQLLVCDLNYLRVKHGQPAPAQMDELTAFADYKIPQFLRHRNVLHYDRNLADKIDNQIEIAPGSKEEIEIRAATIVAVEKLRQEVSTVIKPKACDLDNRLWLAGQNLGKTGTHGQATLKPYHLCRTIYY